MDIKLKNETVLYSGLHGLHNRRHKTESLIVKACLTAILSVPALAADTSFISLLRDVNFEQSIEVKSPEIEMVFTGDTHTIAGQRCPVYRNRATGTKHTIRFGNKDADIGTPVWSMAQWESQANLFPSEGSFINPGTFAWKNRYKFFRLGKPGYGYKTVTFGVNGSQEYDGVLRNRLGVCFETPHPHLLLGQSLPAEIPLGQMDKMLLTFRARITKEEITPEHDSAWKAHGGGTAHFKLHLNFYHVRDDRDKSKGDGQTFGMGINFFDVRNSDRNYQESLFLHRPQRRVMLHLALDSLGENIREKLHGGNWGAIDSVDLMPYVRKAFAQAIEAGKTNDAVQLLISENLDDYYFTSFNFGWEISSLHDVEIQVSDLKIDAAQKSPTAIEFPAISRNDQHRHLSATGPNVQIETSYNPAHSRVNIEIRTGQKNAGVAEISILDIRGNLLRRLGTGSSKASWVWNVSSYPSGVYLVRATVGSRTIVKQFGLIR